MGSSLQLAAELDTVSSPPALPHALGGAVALVAQELRKAQHGLGQHSQEAQGLHKQGRINGQVGDIGSHTRKGQNTLHVVPKAAPVPEVMWVEV